MSRTRLAVPAAAALVAASTFVLTTAAPAQAVAYHIDDAGDCAVFLAAVGAAGGQPLSTTCYVDGGTLAATDSVTTNGWTIRPRSGTFTNNGSIYAVFYSGSTIINNGTMTPAGYNLLFGNLTNGPAGTITAMNVGTHVVLTGNHTNQGSIDVLDGAVVEQSGGTINNTGSIEVACGGEYLQNAGTHTGNPVVELCNNPTITANLTAAHPMNPAGWFRDPVTVSYVCTPGAGATLDAEGCPDPVVVSSEGTDIVQDAVVRQTNKGFKRSRVVLDIDRTAPLVAIQGVDNGAAYTHPPNVSCVAADALSGLESGCTVAVAPTATVGRFAYAALAADKAGNISTVQGTYDVLAPTTEVTYVKITSSRGKAKFKFVGSGNVSSLECSLTKRNAQPKFKPCQAPTTYKKLATGKYTFLVRAVGLGGPDASPGKENFRIRR